MLDRATGNGVGCVGDPANAPGLERTRHWRTTSRRRLGSAQEHGLGSRPRERWAAATGV